MAFTEQEERDLRTLLRSFGGRGNTALLRKLFVIDAEGSVDVAGGTQELIALPSIDISAGLANSYPHRFWLASVVYEHISIFAFLSVGHDAGVGDTGIVAGLQCWIQTRRTTSAPKSIGADLVLSNHTAGTLSGVQYMVVRIAGLGARTI